MKHFLAITPKNVTYITVHGKITQRLTAAWTQTVDSYPTFLPIDGSDQIQTAFVYCHLNPQSR